MVAPINETTRTVIERLFDQDELNRRDEFILEEIETYVDHTPSRELLDLLGPEATEDLVLLYLQSRGWKLVSSSLGSNQAEIECEMVRGGDLGYVQVKSGNASVDPDDYVAYDGSVYLFVGDELDLDAYDEVTQIVPERVVAYLSENLVEVPREVLSQIQDAVGA